MTRNEVIRDALLALNAYLNGGKGSGNWGHLGRPGKRGGSGRGTVGISSSTIDKILKAANENGGMTIDIHGNTKREGIAFAPHKDSEVIIETGALGAVHLKRFVAKNIQKLRHPEANIGGWKNQEDGKWYLDVSHVGGYNADTIRKAQEAHQLAVFDLKTFNEIKTGEIKDGKYIPAGTPEAIYAKHFGRRKRR